MAFTLGNPLIFPVGTNVANLSRSIKVHSIVTAVGSATAVTAQITDVSGSVMFASSYPATIGMNSLEQQSPIILPGGTNAALTNWTVTVTGAGGQLYLYHR